MKEQKSLFDRTFKKEEVLNRGVKIESSDVSADRVNIKRAVDKAISVMRKQIRGLNK